MSQPANELTGKLLELLLEELSIDEGPREGVLVIDGGSRFGEDLGMDSLDLISFVMRVEKAFSVHVPNQKMAAFCTVGDLSLWLQSIEM